VKAFVIACGLGFAILATPLSAQQFVCSGATNSPYPQFVSTYHDHQRVAPKSEALSERFTAFYAAFDDADDDDGDGVPDLRLNPEFVVYELRGVAPDRNGDYAEPPVSIRRPTKWYASPGLVPLVEAIEDVTNRRLDDSYSGAGTVWNRGHLAMSDHAQRISPEAGCNTHVFWNASPQAADLNQGPWLHLENYSAAASNKYRSIWVIAGPIFDASTPKLTIGDPGELQVEIPDAFFKILIHESPSGIDTLAFIFEQPNAIGPDGTPVPTATWVNCKRAPQIGHVYDHRPNLVAVEQIEQRTGLRFFHGRADRQALVRERPTEIWPVETRFWDPGSPCGGQRGHP
jgi:DNA/RNA endonuclease G (NUC1)